MSFIIKGGYDILRKQILNVSLKPTTIWHHGIVYVNRGMVAGTLSPLKENKLEIVNYNNTSTLLLNNSIIYENDKLFDYKIDLSVKDESAIWNDNSMDKYVIFQYNEVKKYNTERILN